MAVPITWLDLAPGSLFGMANLPYGVFSAGDRPRRVGVRIGDSVLDLPPVLGEQVFAEPSLNAFMAQGRARWSDVRARITELLTDERHRRSVEAALYPLSGVRLHRPFEVGDYVDFYASENHAANVGRLFRPGGDALLPNWKHLPVGYHGRSGTVVLSGTPVPRPLGQRPGPTFGPSQRLDFEAEVGFVIGVGVTARRSGSASSRTTCSARSWSTTGRPGTSRPGSPGRSARSWPSRSPRRSRRGSCRSRRWSTPGPAMPPQDPRAAAVPGRHRQYRFRPRARDPAERPGGVPPAVRHHVLDARSDAGPHDRERRLRPAPGTSSPPARSAARTGSSAAACWS